MNLDEPEFWTLAEVLYLHDESLARFGGSAGIREPGLIESALGSAQNTFWYGHGDFFQAAAPHAFQLAESQAFVDGDKQTAVASAIAFLRKNGIEFPKDDGSFHDAMTEIAQKKIGQKWPGGCLKTTDRSTKMKEEPCPLLN